MPPLIDFCAAHSEALVKGLLFDCRRCGQCVLSHTGMVCPTRCPKGLRNGPCGGTIDGRCEVRSDRPCVWVRVHEAAIQSNDRLTLPPLLPPMDPRLAGSSSWLNHLRGRDKASTTPLPYPALPRQRKRQPLLTASRLEQRLKQGHLVRTCELRSPRNASLDALLREARAVQPCFDAVNVTAMLGGQPSLPSLDAAAALVELGIEPIVQFTARDHTRVTFISSLIQAQLHRIPNVLCLTGDAPRQPAPTRQLWDMDAALMVYEARHLRDTGKVRFTDQTVEPPPCPWLGSAINPFTTPTRVAVRRLMQKAAVGVDFVQTQMIFDVAGFAQFMRMAGDHGVLDDVFVIAGVPVITAPWALPLLERIAGVRVPPAVLSQLRTAADQGPAALCDVGLALAARTIDALARIPGVCGFHLMLLGSDHHVLVPLSQQIDALVAGRLNLAQVGVSTESEVTCPSPA